MRPINRKTIEDKIHSVLQGGSILIIVPPFSRSCKGALLDPHQVQAVAAKKGCRADILYLNLLLASFISAEISETVSNAPRYQMLGERLFARSAHGLPPLGKAAAAYAYQLGEACLELLDRIPGTEALKPRTIVPICFYLLGWKEHFKKVVDKLNVNYREALNVGDIEYAAHSLAWSTAILTRTDTELSILKKKIEEAREATFRLKQPLSIHPLLIDLPALENLMGESKKTVEIELDQDGLIAQMPGLKDHIVYFVNIKKTFLSILFDEYENTLEYIGEAEKTWPTFTTPHAYLKSDFQFYIPLAYTRLALRTDEEQEKQEYVAKAQEALKTLEAWSEFGPANFLHKYYLLKAELAQATGNGEEAEEYYDQAIETAYQNEYNHEAAIANEAAAKYYMRNKQDKLAALYFMEARNGYRRWGAKAKVKHLEDTYPKYLNMRIPGSMLRAGTIFLTIHRYLQRVPGR